MSKDPFVPDDYEVEAGNVAYMKFEEGKNKFRILTAPLLGWVWWVDADDNIRPAGDKPQKGDKPVRITRDQEVPNEARATAKEFWAMPVWNYGAEKVQLLEITQKSILRTLVTYVRDEDWGSPLQYDLQVVRTGQKLDTEYEVMALPHKKLDKTIQAQFDEMTVNLEALLEGGDPFGDSDGSKKADTEEDEEDVEIEDMA